MAPSPATRSQKRPMADKLARALLKSERKNRISLGPGPLVLAVSGGADSLALLFAASAVQRVVQRKLLVAHFSHGIRKVAELREATLVKRVAKDLGLTVIHERESVSPSEAAAREARYAFLARTSQSVGAVAVVTAHTRDDQAETLLLRLTRGSGLRGAGAVRELSVRETNGYRLTLLRPFLSVARQETETICAEHSVTPASDGSNRLLRYARNRMRHRVLRELEEVNPRAREALSRFATAAQEDDDLLRRLANDAVHSDEELSQGLVSWSSESIQQLPRPLLVRVLQRGWEAIAGAGAALSQKRIDAAVALVHRSEGGSLDLGAGVRLVVEQGKVKLTRHVDALPLPSTLLVVPGTTEVGGWLIETVVSEDTGRRNGSPWHAMMDWDELGEAIIVRSREAGDRMQLSEMSGSVSLQDLLVNAKMARSDRDSLPIFVGMQGIAWVAGVRIAGWARATNDTASVCDIRVRRVRD